MPQPRSHTCTLESGNGNGGRQPRKTPTRAPIIPLPLIVLACHPQLGHTFAVSLIPRSGPSLPRSDIPRKMQ